MKIKKTATLALSSLMLCSAFATAPTMTADAVSKTPQFTDVTKTNSHYEGIIYWAENGVINGYPTKNNKRMYKPYDNISRQHTALLFDKALDLEAPTNIDKVLKNIKDVSRNDAYAKEIATVYSEGIFGGSNGNFNGDKPLTREQMATVLVKAYNLESSGSETNINIKNVDKSHKDNVQILSDLDITNQRDDFRPRELVTRGQFATFMKRAEDQNEKQQEEDETTQPGDSVEAPIEKSEEKPEQPEEQPGEDVGNEPEEKPEEPTEPETPSEEPTEDPVEKPVEPEQPVEEPETPGDEDGYEKPEFITPDEVEAKAPIVERGSDIYLTSYGIEKQSDGSYKNRVGNAFLSSILLDDDYKVKTLSFNSLEYRNLNNHINDELDLQLTAEYYGYSLEDYKTIVSDKITHMELTAKVISEFIYGEETNASKELAHEMINDKKDIFYIKFK